LKSEDVTYLHANRVAWSEGERLHSHAKKLKRWTNTYGQDNDPPVDYLELLCNPIGYRTNPAWKLAVRKVLRMGLYSYHHHAYAKCRR
jgi:hypothetical protein